MAPKSPKDTNNIGLFDFPSDIQVAELLELIDDPNCSFVTFAHKAQSDPMDSVYTWHKHDKFQIIFSPEGKLELFVQGKGRFLVPQNLGVVIAPRVFHAQLGECKLINIYFSSMLFEDIELSLGAHVFSQNPLILASLNYLAKIGVNDFEEHERNILHVLLHEALKQTHQELFIPETNEPRLQKAVEKIRKNLSYNLSLADVAKAASLSERQLSRLFKDEFGFNFSTYRDLLRLHRAIHEASSGKTLLDICFDLGFEDLSSLNRFFKRMTGKSPKTYLRSQL